jgi:hypothetical protein
MSLAWLTDRGYRWVDQRLPSLPKPAPKALAT